ncbi:MAG: redoxin domain-containing protein, partial [Dehalococcoidia bacterium]|nr:redoxin domain-containing protein [Dehalococcoidia bacterium]
MHKIKLLNIHLTAALLIAALAIIAVACSSDGDSAPPAAPVPTTPPTAAPVVQPTTPPEPPTATPAPPPPTPVPTETPAPQAMEYPSAPDLRQTGGWINSEPFTLDEAQEEGKVVLIDFWTYTCINCIRTLPYVREWHDKYADHGLVILGVHTPEFAFEHEYDNVVEAAGKFELEYPIVQDNEFGTWRAFNNRYWPAKYLIDHNGKIRYNHFGEGAYDETEMKIREILEEAGVDVSSVAVGSDPGP